MGKDSSPELLGQAGCTPGRQCERGLGSGLSSLGAAGGLQPGSSLLEARVGLGCSGSSPAVNVGTRPTPLGNLHNCLQNSGRFTK